MYLPPIKFYVLWMFRVTKLSSWDFSNTKYFQIIYFICSSLYLLQYFAMTVSICYVIYSYCRHQSLSHSPPQQNFRQVFFSFGNVWGYPTSLISWFINFNNSFTANPAWKAQESSKQIALQKYFTAVFKEVESTTKYKLLSIYVPRYR